jgi:signal transduction histidine kinase
MKLILSYALIIALCLTLTALVSAVLLRNYQNRFAKQRIEIIADTTAPLLHDNNDPARFDAAAQVRRTADQTQTRLIVLEAALRDLTSAQQRAARGGNNVQRFNAVVQQDTAGLLPEGTTVAVPREVYESWQRWLREQATTTARAGTPTAPPLKNAQLTLPGATISAITLHTGRPLDLALIPLRAEKGMPSGDFRVLVVAEPVGSAARPLATVIGTFAPAAGIAFLVSIIGALILARSISKPLIGLTAATRALASGDYQRRVAIHGDDEVAELGRSFNAMASDIERVRRRERDFLANISHDLKTPLTSIQGFAGALIDGTCPPDAYPDAARIIYGESQRMGQLVGDILQLSRLEAGELPLAVAPVDLTALLRATARRFVGTAAKAGVSIRLENAPEHPIIALADQGRLEQVLGNLVENALRYTPPGGRIDLIGARQEGAGQPSARLAVRDTGGGIAASDLPRIFERFYQADKSRVAGRAGSGLGLAIVKELIERHGGTVHAESVIGAGTTITMTLPLAPDERRQREAADTPVGAPTATEATTTPAGMRRER